MLKYRLDYALTERGIVSGRDKAKALIMTGFVYVNGQKSDKSGTMVTEDDTIECRAKSERYVSRGGYKLEKAIGEFKLDLKGKICMDIGASTGGFTDCMLQNGAKKVYAVDVGYGQLAWELRQNSQVVNMERTNIRYIDKEIEKIDFISVDVSFISLSKVCPIAYEILTDNGEMVCLIKPQFEAGKGKVGKNGVIKDAKLHIEVIENVVKFIKEMDFTVMDLSFSPIQGPKGNIEFLIHLKKSVSDKNESYPDMTHIVDLIRRSHESFTNSKPQ